MTGLRGVAAFLVATYHFCPPTTIPSNTIPDVAVGNFVGKGYLWVDLFFILSGFLMGLNYGHMFEGSWSVRRWLDFLLRRFARVYPLYIVIVATVLLYTAFVYGSFQGSHPAPAVGFDRPFVALTANVLLIQSWGLASSIDGVAWSLSTEWAAYLLFPFLAWLALFGSRRTTLAAALLVAAVVIGTVGLTAHDGAYHSGPLDAYDGRTIEPILRCFGGFVLGLLMYRASRSDRMLAWASSDVTLGAAVAALVAGFAAGLHDLVVYPLFAILVLGLYGNRGRMGWLFGCRPVYWLGVVSYSLYLLHSYLLVPRNWLSRSLHGILSPVAAQAAADATACAVLLVLSGLAYRLIEEPGRKWMRRFGKALATPPPEAAAREETRRAA